MCLLFGRTQPVIARHISNVFKEGELPKEGFMQILHKTSKAGGRPVAIYNLDVVISVGYRVKSFQGTRFRQWATRILREMLLNRLDEVKRIGALERRLDSVEGDVKQLKGGMKYLVQKSRPRLQILLAARLVLARDMTIERFNWEKGHYGDPIVSHISPVKYSAAYSTRRERIVVVQNH